MLRPLVLNGRAVVDQVDPVGDDLEVRLRLDDPELGHRQVAVQRERRRPVLEHAVGGVLEPEQPVGEHRDPEPVALDDRRAGSATGREGKGSRNGMTPVCGQSSTENSTMSARWSDRALVVPLTWWNVTP